MLEGDAGWPASCLTMSFSGKGGLQTAPTSFVALDLRGHRWLSMTAPFTFPRVRGNQKGASPVCGGTRRGLTLRAGESGGVFDKCIGPWLGGRLICFAAASMMMKSVDTACRAQHDKRSGVARALPHPVTLSVAKVLRSCLATWGGVCGGCAGGVAPLPPLR